MRTVADANLHVGTTHLAGLLRRYGGDPVPAIAAYNAGGTPVGRWLRQPGVQERVLFVERITYAETQGYVRTVLRNRDLYLALYGPGATVAEP
jgi:soluble lytic murein transglycosylase